VNLEPADRSRRRIVGRINGGGTPIQLSTTNGAIRVQARGHGVSASPAGRGAAFGVQPYGAGSIQRPTPSTPEPGE